MTTIKLKGSGARNWFAEQLVKDHGAAEARERTCGPMRKAVEDVIASLPKERECCGTFPRTPHRATCEKYRGKFKPANGEVTGAKQA